MRIAAPEPLVARHVPPTVGTVEAVDESACVLVAGGSSLDWMALHLARLPWPIEVLEPPELIAAMRDLAARLTAAARIPLDAKVAAD